MFSSGINGESAIWASRSPVEQEKDVFPKLLHVPFAMHLESI